MGRRNICARRDLHQAKASAIANGDHAYGRGGVFRPPAQDVAHPRDDQANQQGVKHQAGSRDAQAIHLFALHKS